MDKMLKRDQCLNTGGITSQIHGSQTTREAGSGTTYKPVTPAVLLIMNAEFSAVQVNVPKRPAYRWEKWIFAPKRV
jgi:hypothetical protein